MRAAKARRIRRGRGHPRATLTLGRALLEVRPPEERVVAVAVEALLLAEHDPLAGADDIGAGRGQRLADAEEEGGDVPRAAAAIDRLERDGADAAGRRRGVVDVAERGEDGAVGFRTLRAREDEAEAAGFLVGAQGRAHARG